MKITFQLRFHTQFGQALWLAGNHPLLGRGSAEAAIPLHYVNDECWRAELLLEEAAVPRTALTYEYVLRNADGSRVQDWGGGRNFNPAAFRDAEGLLIIDTWNHPGAYENAFVTKPFTEVLLKRESESERGCLNPSGAKRSGAFRESGHALEPGAAAAETAALPDGDFTHEFRVRAPLLKPGQTLCLLGNRPALGNWDTVAPLLLGLNPSVNCFSIELSLADTDFPLEYKYGVYDLEADRFVSYESGQNRVLRDTTAPKKRTLVNDGFAALPSDTWRGAGVAIPVFSLRSERSFGTGEFTDLRRLADWCHVVGLKLIQLLPINDTTATRSWKDSYPYSAISAFALHPLYLDLGRVVNRENQPLLAGLEPERKRLNAPEALDYEPVLLAKLAFLKRVYALQREETFQSAGFTEFFERNKAWLEPYAMFCSLRDKYGTADFTQWPLGAPPPLGAPASLPASSNAFEAPEKLAGKDAGAPSADAATGELGFHYFVQYHLHLQLQEAVEYAHAKGVVLKGDLPIGVFRHGADAWQQPELYHMELQAGAPPDPFSAKGQNWSFPTYNWERMKQDGFAWWKRRFEQLGHYFDAFRIDHILGFFRIWSIPLHAVEGVMGHFAPAIPVHIDEFERLGIRFDRSRFVRPYITDQVLGEVFGPSGTSEKPGSAISFSSSSSIADSPEAATQRIETVKEQFLRWDGLGKYSLRPEFTTQRQVESHFAGLAQTTENARLQQGLYDLISNVILFEAEGTSGKGFHFRFGMEDTSSFKALDAQTQGQLKALYVDYFFRRQDAFWATEAMQKLPALKRATTMLACGEDLGMVPECVPGVMRELGFLSLEVQRMPKGKGREFSSPKDAPYLSVVTPSTHDMSTIRGWWKEDRRQTQKFYNLELGLSDPAPAECEPWLNQAIVDQHLASPAMWSIFQLQDLLGMDEHLRHPDPDQERINIPANPKHRWCYRMHLTLETLLEAKGFNEQMRERVKASGR